MTCRQKLGLVLFYGPVAVVNVGLFVALAQLAPLVALWLGAFLLLAGLGFALITEAI